MAEPVDWQVKSRRLAKPDGEPDFVRGRSFVAEEACPHLPETSAMKSILEHMWTRVLRVERCAAHKIAV